MKDAIITASILFGVIYLIGIISLIIEFWKILNKNEDRQTE